MMVKTFSRRYFLTGLVLIAGLIAIVLLLRILQTEGMMSASGGKIKGPINAPIEMIEFSDFQCPACQKAAQVMEEVFKRYPGKIRLSFYHFPLKMHKWAMLAHQAAECAAGQGKFWPYHDLLYARQKDWSGLADPRETFKGYARELGLNSREFDVCLDQNGTLPIVLEDIQQGQLQKVGSTPTFIVNGKRIVGGKMFASDIDRVINEELGK